MKKIKMCFCFLLAILLMLGTLPVGDFAINANAVSEEWWMPLTSYVSIGDPFGCTCSVHNGSHNGQDFPAYEGTTVRATKSGTVVAVVTYCKGSHYNGSCSCGSSWGNYVKIKHSDGFYSLYAHLSSVSVSNGQSVSQGQTVGGVGTTGHSTGNHLHFEIYNTSNVRVNPMNYINPQNPSPVAGSNHIQYSYDSHCRLEVTEPNKHIMTLPCSDKTDSKSDSVEVVAKGDKLEAIELIFNSQDNYWYKVISEKTGKTGYIYAGNVEWIAHKTTDVTGPGISVPANHTQGKSYPLSGSVTATNSELTKVSVYIYPGTKTSGTSETGYSQSVSGKSFALGGSAIDSNTVFNILGTGQHTYVVTASCKYSYATSGTTKGTKTVDNIRVYTQTFNVVSSHSHSYSSHYEADHPHKVYNKCSCGDWYYTGATTSVSSCSQCNPTESSTIIYPTSGSVYKIASGVGNNMYLDFACTNTNVQIYENCDGHSDPAFVKSQYFKFTHVGDGWYSIINIGNGMAVDVDGGNSASGTNIHQWAYDGNNAQLFRFYDAGDGYCYIKSKLGTYVDVANGDAVSNTNVWAYAFNGSNAQKWKIQTHSHSYSSTVTTSATCTKTGVKTFTCYCGVSYTETIPATGHANDWGDNKCENCGEVLFAEPTKILYPENNQVVKIAPSFVSGMFLNHNLETNNIQIYENLDGNNNDALVKSQYFRLIHVGDGWYIISNVSNGKVVDVEGGVAASKTNIGLHGLHYGDNQMFRFYDAGDGYCYIKSKLGCYMDVAHGQNTNNANVWAHAFNGNAAEKWKLINHSHSYISEVITPATHKEEGIAILTCICGDSYTDTIATIPHTYNAIITAPTCIEQGYTTYTCICGDSYISDYTDKADHNYESITTEPTCTKEGYITYTCTVCGYSYIGTVKIPALKHIYYLKSSVDPTCTMGGSKTYSCINCKGEYIEKTEALGHNPGPEANCTENQVCNVCRKIITEKLGHSFVWVIDNEATCSSTGLKHEMCSRCDATQSENTIIPATGNHFYSQKVTKPTCTEKGYTTYTCVCGDSYVDNYTDVIEHEYTAEITTPATSTSEGVKTYTCSCGHTYTEVIPKLTIEVGAIIQFGSYPQSEVKDATLIAELNTLAPSWNDWISYDYYCGDGNKGTMIQGDWMRYADVTYKGYKYRGVKFTQYRPPATYLDATESVNRQSENGYYTNIIYWFKYEPIEWRILDSTSGLVMCETIIDAQPYSNTLYSKSGVSSNFASFNDPSYTNFASDYETSSIRKWLNEDFYHIAFTETEKTMISTTSISNKCYATLHGDVKSSSLDSCDTSDKIFLLAYDEISNPNFKFNSDLSVADEAKRAEGSAYAQCQGLFVYQAEGLYYGTSGWMLRTPSITSYLCCRIMHYGYSQYGNNVDAIDGIRPALCLESISHQHTYTSEITTQPTHLTEGIETFTCVCGDLYIATIEKLKEHTYEKTVTEPTCTERGFTTFICKCGDNYVDEYVASIGHKYIGTVTTIATCKVNGVKTYTCEYDEKHTYTENLGLNASNHVNTVNTDAIAPTCSAVGFTAGVYCNDCEKYISGHEEIAIDAEVHKWDNGTITTTATCKVSGVKTYICQHDATHKKTENLGVNASNHINTKNTEAVAPNCSASGYTEGVYCNDCEKYISGHEEIAIDTDAHKWDNGSITTTATCKVSGVKTYTCQHNASHKKTENLGVNASNHVNTKNVAEVKATCTTKGYTAGVYCNDCQKYISGHAEIAINPANHVNTKNVPETPATFEAVGYTEGVYCNDCKKYISGHTEIPKLVPVFTDSNDAKESGNDIISNNGLTVAQLLSQAGKGAVIKTTDGKSVENAALIGTGMVLTMADGSKKEIVVYGDVDGDGKISAADARQALRASVGLENFKEDSAKYKAANVESKDKLSAADARLILRASVGLEDPKSWMK